jgi:hypothetical protein
MQGRTKSFVDVIGLVAGVILLAGAGEGQPAVQGADQGEFELIKPPQRPS